MPSLRDLLLACAVAVDSHAITPEALECLATLASDAGSHREAARLFGAADALRKLRPVRWGKTERSQGSFDAMD